MMTPFAFSTNIPTLPASAIVMLRHVLAIPQGEWLLQSAAGSELGRMIIKLAKHDGIRTINVVRRRASVAELERLGQTLSLCRRRAD
jgi:NADPH:quinone reductase-like Zn-dependent oxidoreductase